MRLATRGNLWEEQLSWINKMHIRLQKLQEPDYTHRKHLPGSRRHCNVVHNHSDIECVRHVNFARYAVLRFHRWSSAVKQSLISVVDKWSGKEEHNTTPHEAVNWFAATYNTVFPRQDRLPELCPVSVVRSAGSQLRTVLRTVLHSPTVC